MMDIYLIIGVVCLAYVGALIVTLLAKKEPMLALSGGTIAWLILFFAGFSFVFTDTAALGIAVIGGALIQYIVVIKSEFDSIYSEK